MVDERCATWPSGVARCGLAPGCSRSAQVPLDVEETGGFDRPDHACRLVQHEVEVDVVFEPLVEVADTLRHRHGEDQPSARGEGMDQGRDRVGSSDCARWLSEYHPRAAAHPGLAAGRLSRRRSPTSKLRSGNRRRASFTIAGKVDPPLRRRHGRPGTP